jgi:hypothetical protein
VFTLETLFRDMLDKALSNYEKSHIEDKVQYVSTTKIVEKL